MVNKLSAKITLFKFFKKKINFLESAKGIKTQVTLFLKADRVLFRD